nr:RidA family protein [uncultured Moellerella sp.]
MNKSPFFTQNPPEMPAPAGHYSYTQTAGNMIFISGLLPINEQGEPLKHKDFKTQVEQVLKNLEYCLAATGAKRSQLAQLRVYIADMGLWPEFNSLYANWIGEFKPARAVAGVNQLHYDLLIEIEAIAIKEN